MNHYVNLKYFTLFVVSSIITFITPIIPLIAIVLAFILFDTLFGLFKSYRKDIPITSKTLSNAGVKIFIYTSTILLVFILDKLVANGELLYIIKEIPYLATKSVALFWVFVESLSIYENIRIITGVDYYSKIKLVLRRTKFIKKEVTEIFTKDNSSES